MSFDPPPDSMREHQFYGVYGKRLLDVVGASCLLVLTLPIMGCLAVAVWGTLGSPIMFRQARPGWRSEIFRLTKFRTMRPAGSSEEGVSADHARLTKLGRWMRATSTDELPELFQVLSGRMSLVGPRPLLPEYLARYSARQARRHEVRPGLTGLAQVNGRNALDWDARLELDVQYVDRVSFALDCAILGKTLVHVVTRQGISQPGRATVDEFMGPRTR